MNILLITPPLTQLNTPYPATACLKGFLQKKGYCVNQFDLGIELINRLFTEGILCKIFEEAINKTAINKIPSKFRSLINNRQRYIDTIDPVMHFLRGNDPTLSTRICSRSFLPEGSRFKNLADIEWAFGEMGLIDKAKYLATLYIEDLTDFIRENIDSHFDLNRYGEKLALYMPELTIDSSPTIIDRLMISILDEQIKAWKPDIIGFSIPFPGNLYGALKCGQFIKVTNPNCKVVFGGGYINTELRELSDNTIFKYCDFVILDDGEAGLLNLLEHLEGKITKENLIKTFIADENGDIILAGEANNKRIPFSETGIPDYSGLPLKKYLSLIEITNPMHKLWSDGRWNKLTLAHGCYWGKCTFCDTTLPYISCYDPASAQISADRIQAIIKQTKETGFHFTDEAAPPKILRELSEEIINRRLSISWWTNIRFEKAFTDELCFLLAQSGCIAVSGGIEVASDRILKLINKGITIEQAIKTADNFTRNGIMVHTYLMYGFPKETIQETIDSLEIVRQMFSEGLIQSAFWHRYAMTVHSLSGIKPEDFGAKHINHTKGSFANNEIPFTDGQNIDLEMIGEGLRRATFNYMHGLCLDWPVNKWFEGKVPKTMIREGYVRGIIN